MIVIDYVVATATSLIGLQGRVRNYLQEGYQPYGSLVVETVDKRSPHGLNETNFYQAMAMYEDTTRMVDNE